MVNEIDILASRWREMQGKEVTKVPQIIIDRTEAIESLLEDVDEVYATKDGKAAGDRLTKNIKKLEKTNDEEKRKLGLQVVEYLASGTKRVEAPAPRDRIAGKPGAARRVRNALNPTRR